MGGEEQLSEDGFGVSSFLFPLHEFQGLNSSCQDHLAKGFYLLGHFIDPNSFSLEDLESPEALDGKQMDVMPDTWC